MGMDLGCPDEPQGRKGLKTGAHDDSAWGQLTEEAIKGLER